MIETVTTQEATEILRACGMRISLETIRLGIEQGAYPFGICIRTEKSPVYQVFKKQLDQWIAERST